jgi:hypothetical protein
MKSEVKNELMEILNIFQAGYIKRDVNNIDNFMDAMFDKNENVVIVGTGAGEWCIGYEEAKEIFLSDWEYWGDLRINPSEASIIPIGDTAIIYTTGTIKYSFKSVEDTYSRYLGGIKKYFDGVSYNSNKPDKLKLAEINWTLCHLLSQRDGGEREYLWDLRISFVLIKKEARWIIRQMQFSLPTVGYLPDVRIDSFDNNIEYFNAETEKMRTYLINNTKLHNSEIIEMLRNFNNEYLDINKKISTIANQYFTSSNPYVINIDKAVFNNLEEIERLIEDQRESYDELSLNFENCLINSNEGVVWIATNGTMKKVISEKRNIENTIDIIKNIFTNASKNKDKLFNIRRRIADTFKENAKGEQYIWPFRLEGVLIKETDNWVFKYLQFSLPSDWILEGKTEAASAVE